MTGKIPQHGDVQGTFINVEVVFDDFPIIQPRVRLVSINAQEELYNYVPQTWRHLDEFNNSLNATQSTFYICALHNWSANPARNGNFIYYRILSWLESNVSGVWNEDEDLPTRRIIPQFSNAILYLPESFLDHLKEEETKTIFSMDVSHTTYTFISGAVATKKKKGNEYDLEQIKFEKRYFFFPSVHEGNAFTHLTKMKLGTERTSSKLLIVRLPGNYVFKTFYQLLISIRMNTELLKLADKSRNFPVLVMFKGDRGRDEAIAFLASKEYLQGKSEFLVKLMKLESIAQRPVSVDLTVGLLGVGALGSQVAKILSMKETKSVLICDPDILSMENIGRHELDPVYLGLSKSLWLARELNYKSLTDTFHFVLEDEEVHEKSDILVVTVGDKQSFDKLAFKKLSGYKKPIIWAWTSPNNILQEIVITNPSTGCLNCYYATIQSDPDLLALHEQAKKEINNAVTVEFDICGNPHTTSHMEKMIFFATQIVSILSYYSKNKRFRFDYVNYYWEIDEIIPYTKVGYLETHHACTCKGDR